MTLRNGKLKDKDVKKDLQDHGTYAELECNPNYHNPVSKFLCKDGKFQGISDDTEITCYKGGSSYLTLRS